MADVNLPQMNQLAQMEFMSPMMFNQGMKQIDLGNQFAQQNLAQGEQDLQSKTLANMFQVQNDPLRLQKAQQDIEGTTSDNILKKINAEQRQALAPMELEAKRAKMVKEWSDSKLEKAMNDAQEMMWSDNPEVAAKGRSLYANSFKEVSARMKAKDELTKQEAENASRERIATGNNQTAKDVANIYSTQRGEAARLKAGGGQADFDSLMARYGKTYEARQGLYESQAIRAEREGDMETAAQYRAMAERERIQNERKIGASADARLAAQPDLPAMTRGRVQERGTQLPAVPAMPTRGVGGPVADAPRGAFDLGPNNERLPGIRQFIASRPAGPERQGAEAALAEQLSRGAPAPQPKPAGEQKPMLADVQKMYPGVPAAKLKEAYKKKFGVDLQ